MKGDDQKALGAGCDGYITKPIDTRIFPAQVAKFLENLPAKTDGGSHEK
jgi:CheY-like chemotaxis protein